MDVHIDKAWRYQLPFGIYNLGVSCVRLFASIYDTGNNSVRQLDVANLQSTFFLVPNLAVNNPQ
jgi:hypothetical protein